MVFAALAEYLHIPIRTYSIDSFARKLDLHGAKEITVKGYNPLDRLANPKGYGAYVEFSGASASGRTIWYRSGFLDAVNSRSYRDESLVGGRSLSMGSISYFAGREELDAAVDYMAREMIAKISTLAGKMDRHRQSIDGRLEDAADFGVAELKRRLSSLKITMEGSPLQKPDFSFRE